MVHVQIKYITNKFDIVPDNMLNVLIMSNLISHFYRPSEMRWINVKNDPVRKAERIGDYRGPERRESKR